MRSPTLQAIRFFATLTVPLRGAAPQQLPPLDSGAPLRVFHDCSYRTLSSGRTRLQCKTVRGTFAGLTGESLLLRTSRATDARAIALTSIEKLEVSRPSGESRSDSELGGRIAGQVLVGGATGVASSIVFAAMGAAIGSDSYADAVAGMLVAGILGGAALGSSIPVYLIGRGGPAKGSFGATVLGSLLGTVAFFGIRSAADLDANHTPFWIAFYGLPLAGAIGGYYVSATRSTEHWISMPLEGLRL